ncbi:hypothetical protein OE88DRAFT_1714398 [Heliocybe sulcata]|uniref:Uncharacterized protein n=1 Tax=Heliocybe sulcata TaxID=5364 RepID=A0A5C3MS53_9AGAM|nr:hypothetical protein OE88DRAFT_1714398 [Heliocybe sulcata]
MGIDYSIRQLRAQLLVFWRNQYPFDQPLDGQDTLTWWEGLQHHPSADILAMLAIRIFSILVNSMADERTGSCMTLTDMIMIGQWYGTHIKKDKKTKERRRPTVKFREINKDILRSIQGLKPDSDEQVPDNVTDDSNDKGDDEGDRAGGTTADNSGVVDSADSEEVPVSVILVEDEIDLDSVFLRDLVSPEPASSPTAATEKQKVPEVLPAAKPGVVDWDW